MSRDAWMTIRKSVDGAHNWGAASHHFLGEVGAFCVAVIRRRIGQSRQLDIKSSVSSPTRVDILGLAIEVEREQ